MMMNHVLWLLRLCSWKLRPSTFGLKHMAKDTVALAWLDSLKSLANCPSKNEKLGYNNLKQKQNADAADKKVIGVEIHNAPVEHVDLMDLPRDLASHMVVVQEKEVVNLLVPANPGWSILPWETMDPTRSRW